MKQLLLENIRSAHNVGSIFRTADGAGVSKLFLSGYTPAPTDRFARVQPEIRKTSLGASEYISWEKVGEDTGAFLREQKRAGVTVVALEQTATAIPLREFVVPEQVLYVVGNEVDGVSKAVLDEADVIVEIPMLGQKESLNVSVATGILLYHELA
ncbi:TrmH family RNA methyltransferase [Candidatus Kaiserbacteria bacterium]|nr:TrmH family RNA methyltransferase [Candidatus Kaiserbacteria bacterium]